MDNILRYVIENMPAGVIVADADGRFVLWNEAAVDLVGMGPMDVPTDEWSDEYQIYYPDKLTIYPAGELPLARALRGETVVNETLYLKNRGVWVSANSKPIFTKAGQMYGVVTLQDVSELYKLIESITARMKQLMFDLEKIHHVLRITKV